MASKAHKFNYVALVIGVCVAIWTLILLSGRLDFIKSTVATQGTVVQLNYGKRHPEITFVTQTGEHVSFPASFVSVAVGDSVPVRYDPAKPRATAEVDTFMNMWLETLISAAFTIAFLYAGLTGQSFRPRYG
ncbi:MULTISPECIES: DUF3592 domain-containing protein [Burkholderia]|uniref:DUF3592 domain-containing protein n=1 Tax=Burkholderia TaxID=32008 RepID=UPI000E658E89|nr:MULTISPECIES: DUF3592 domain-containing protein [Burkholderia]MCR5893341.1 hypothetical protein [Burkholderia sp. HAN2018]UQO33017.1 DUF3592 domain-containing protein [Burkholderia cepacia]UQO46512.1 DUF3592 domain-containing protein [Burkholderia cepacia]UQP11592.1 DUF3592 domain-containing protein [Burkholderia cepacia]